TYEIIVVDDGSTDDSPQVLAALARRFPALRPLRLAAGLAGSAQGQSAAFAAGFAFARGHIIATMDADLQNDPADLPGLIDVLHATGVDLVQGNRTRARAEGLIRRATSGVGRLARRLLLRDSVEDTGCSLRVMRAAVADRLPLEFAGMHRFIPITAEQLGFTVCERPVTHRPRSSGRGHYGVWNRAWPGLLDCLAVRWMGRRRRVTDATPIVTDASKPLDRQPAPLERSA
ncbi:MAG: glycosyltransferase, partial [Phycisphaerae bacterium]|nr:glycosyltransferase [Phycisphaerae bacterium]